MLRFDYQGCGDSAGDCEFWQIERWIGDLQASIDELKQRASISRVGLVGLRLGGTLAVLGSAGRNDIEEMVLLGPSGDRRCLCGGA